MIDVIGIDGNTSLIAPSTALLNYACAELGAAEVRSEVVQLRKLPAEDLLLGRSTQPAIRRSIQQIRAANGIVISTCSRHTCMNGALNLFLELLPEALLAGKVVLPIITEHEPNHAGNTDKILRPALIALHARTVLPTVYVNENQVRFEHGRVLIGGSSQAALRTQLQNFTQDLRTLARSNSARVLRPFTLADYGISA